MFDLPEHKLTWEVVGNWTSADYDYEYRVTFKSQPMTQKDSMIGSSFFPNGKPYWLTAWFYLKGSQLFVGYKRPGPEFNDFQEKSLFKLTGLSPMTRPVVQRMKPRFMSTTDRGRVIGEQFFHLSDRSDILPFHKAFWIRYPSDNDSIYDWQDALQFVDKIRNHIHEINQSEQDGGGQPATRSESK